MNHRTLLCNIGLYKAMLNAYADRETEFEYAEGWWSTDDVCYDFIRDLKCGNLKLSVEKNGRKVKNPLDK